LLQLAGIEADRLRELDWVKITSIAAMSSATFYIRHYVWEMRKTILEKTIL